ncbi:MAG: GntR family transcriptional regulator [Eggerthellaceae bacterium]|nr:GntR family transcriptional regulator [Eggerthellaceae bacterium]
MESHPKSFTFEVDKDSNVAVWMQLRKRIAYLISTGYFKPGDQLPKIRELAADISINFNTVNKAYLSLQSDGYVVSVRGKGVFVSDVVKNDADVSGDIEAILDDCLRACRQLGVGFEDAAALMTQRAKYLRMMESVPRRVPGTNIIAVGAEGDADDSRKEA